MLPECQGKGFGYSGLSLFFCIMNAVSILFAEELFRFELTFKVRNVDNVEPSEWEITARYLGWTFLTIVALIIFNMGL